MYFVLNDYYVRCFDTSHFSVTIYSTLSVTPKPVKGKQYEHVPSFARFPLNLTLFIQKHLLLVNIVVRCALSFPPNAIQYDDFLYDQQYVVYRSTTRMSNSNTVLRSIRFPNVSGFPVQ